MRCQLGEHLLLFEPIADIPKLTLRWPDADSDLGVSRGRHGCLESRRPNEGLYAELIKAMTLWEVDQGLAQPQLSLDQTPPPRLRLYTWQA